MTGFERSPGLWARVSCCRRFSPEGALERRDFVTSAIAIAGAALSGAEGARRWRSASREFYQLRKYALQTGPQLALAQNYFEHALIPALEPDGDGSGGRFQAGYRSGDADILFVDSGNFGGSVGHAGHAACRGCGVHEIVRGVLGSAGIGTGVRTSGEFADVGVRGMANTCGAEERQENFPAANLRERRLMPGMSEKYRCSTKRKSESLRVQD